MEKLFDTFDIKQKIEELKGFFSCSDLSAFDSKHIVIAIPSLDESGRFIKQDDPELFDYQDQDAHYLANFIMGHTEADAVSILVDSQKVYKLVDSISEPLDFLILLHEFIPSEKDYLVSKLQKENDFGVSSENLQMIEVY